MDNLFKSDKTVTEKIAESIDDRKLEFTYVQNLVVDNKKAEGLCVVLLSENSCQLISQNPTVREVGIPRWCISKTTMTETNLESFLKECIQHCFGPYATTALAHSWFAYTTSKNKPTVLIVVFIRAEAIEVFKKRQEGPMFYSATSDLFPSMLDSFSLKIFDFLIVQGFLQFTLDNHPPSWKPVAAEYITHCLSCLNKSHYAFSAFHGCCSSCLDENGVSIKWRLPTFGANYDVIKARDYFASIIDGVKRKYIVSSSPSQTRAEANKILREEGLELKPASPNFNTLRRSGLNLDSLTGKKDNSREPVVGWKQNYG